MTNRILGVLETGATVGLSITAAVAAARATHWAFDQLRKRLESQ